MGSATSTLWAETQRCSVATEFLRRPRVGLNRYRPHRANEINDTMTAQAWVALGLGLPSLIIAFFTWRQRNANDARDQWWKRAIWAVDKSLDDGKGARDVGAAALATIYAEHTPRGVDRRLVEDFARELLNDDTTGQSAVDCDNGETQEGGGTP